MVVVGSMVITSDSSLVVADSGFSGSHTWVILVAVAQGGCQRWLLVLVIIAGCSRNVSVVVAEGDFTWWSLVVGVSWSLMVVVDGWPWWSLAVGVRAGPW